MTTIANPSRRVLLAALLALGVLCAGAGPAVAQTPEEDANLEQRIAPGQRIVGARKILAAGHVDVGPRFVDETWTLMIHDDAAKAGGGESVWRHTERTVLRVTDDAILEAPEDPAYRFLHAKPGTDVYVVPQTQNPDVVWVGWNTQDPEVMQAVDRGATMTLTGVQGPGSLVVYLQSGSFSEPKVLWDSTTKPKPVWLDVNTHTHANWVFSAPGVYLVQVKISADLVDGSTVTDTRELRFAVGSATSADDAFAAAWEGAATDSDADVAAAATPTEDGGASSEADDMAIVAILLAAVALAGGLGIVVVRGRRAKARARAAATGAARPVDDEPHAGGA